MIFTAITAGKKVSGHPVGSAPVLASYLAEAQKGWEGRTIIAEDGDLWAPPPESALLQDEPSLAFFNMLGNRTLNLKKDLLKPGLQANLGVEPGYWSPLSNLVGVVGNSRIRQGKKIKLLRRLYGGNFVAPANSNATDGPFLENPWKGANYPTLAANVVATDTGKHILPPYVIKVVHGMPIGFIGAVLKDTPTMVMPRECPCSPSPTKRMPSTSRSRS